MDFATLHQNAMGNQQEILTRSLMELGILKQQPVCALRHDQVNMELRNETVGMRWRCLRCTNTKSVKLQSFFQDSKVPLCKWIEVIGTWIDGSGIKDIKDATNLSKNTVTEMLRHLRELCQTYLVTNNPRFGGAGRKVVIKILKNCGENCNILFLKSRNDLQGYLLHNTAGRYDADGDNEVPTLNGSIVYTNLELNTPDGTVVLPENEYPGNFHDSFNHSLVWIRSKRGIKCNKAGAFLAEYNFRFAIGNDDVKNRFIYAMAAVYEHIH